MLPTMSTLHAIAMSVTGIATMAPLNSRVVRVPIATSRLNAIHATATTNGGLSGTAIRDERHGRSQEFYARLVKPREVEHDSHVFNAYLREAEKLAERDARIDRISLDYELKREHQQWLHERDRDGNGRPNREPDEIEQWARDHNLPYFDDQVHFPDLRIEYEEIDGRHDHQDVEVLTVHYRGGHG